VRPWTLAAWIFLTLGIAMGSYWAYYELGWGGWWFWDPVENASLMPWLAGTALLHSAVVMEKRNALKVWTILLSILTFSLSLLGTFLVRSGVLTSVHAFATDPTRGVFILLILCIFIGGSFRCMPGARRAEAGRAVRADLARGRAGAQQSVADHGLRHGVHRHAVSAGAGGDHRRQDLGRRAVLQPDLRAAVRSADDRGAVRPLLAWKRGDLLGAAQRLSDVMDTVGARGPNYRETSPS
jgi:cytochrome c-type biogenesis protein CcmF